MSDPWREAAREARKERDNWQARALAAEADAAALLGHVKALLAHPNPSKAQVVVRNAARAALDGSSGRAELESLRRAVATAASQACIGAESGLDAALRARAAGLAVPLPGEKP